MFFLKLSRSLRLSLPTSASRFLCVELQNGTPVSTSIEIFYSPTQIEIVSNTILTPLLKTLILSHFLSHAFLSLSQSPHLSFPLLKNCFFSDSHCLPLPFVFSGQNCSHLFFYFSGFFFFFWLFLCNVGFFFFFFWFCQWWVLLLFLPFFFFS